MFSKSIITSVLILALGLQVHGHAAIAPALGVKGGAPQRNDVQQPTDSNPCGNIDIASTISNATTVAAEGNKLNANVTNFNAGADGSRHVTVQIDATGTGKSFKPANVTTNGDAAPTDVKSQLVTIELPEGTTCPSGKCLASFKTDAGFGNCVAFTVGAATVGGAKNNARNVVAFTESMKAKRDLFRALTARESS